MTFLKRLQNEAFSVFASTEFHHFRDFERITKFNTRKI